MTTFTEYVKKYEKKDNLRGDFAIDWRDDASRRPEPTSVGELVCYLRYRAHACKQAIETGKYLWKRYEKHLLREKIKQANQS